jgi:adenosylcobinamide-GDP ribazoletransferase
VVVVLGVTVPVVATPLRAIGAAAAGLGLAWALRATALRRLGGLTGDVLGAVVEAATAGCLVTLSLTW